jgi:hypothetical protein
MTDSRSTFSSRRVLILGYPVRPDPNPAFEALVYRIRHEIAQNGEAIVGETELDALAGERSGRAQWNMIAKIAIAEHWSFTFFPNGNVRFAKLTSEEQH